MAAVTAENKLRLSFYQSPGDTVVATAAVRCLHEQFPGRFLTDVAGTASDEVFANSPYRTKLPEARVVRMENPLINECDKRPVHFLESYTHHLGKVLEISLKCTVNRPELFISEEEKHWMGQVQEFAGKAIPYWLITSSVKKDYTVKGFGYDRYQEVVNALRGRVQFVQVGAAEHDHKPLSGVINLLGKTDLRQLIRLVYHAEGGVGPDSLLHHIFASFNKPFVCLLSGFLPRSWVAYPSTTILTKQQVMWCCKVQGACWRARTVALGDGDAKDSSLCELPVYGGAEPVPKCMALITPAEVAAAVLAY